MTLKISQLRDINIRWKKMQQEFTCNFENKSNAQYHYFDGTKRSKSLQLTLKISLLRNINTMMEQNAEKLYKHLLRFVQVNEEDFAEIFTYFNLVAIDKKKNLLTEGKICRSNFFVVKGCLRMFFINEKGVEQTTQFALENWWLADYASYTSQTPAEYYIQAVEKSELLALDHLAQEKMLQKFPSLERYFRLVHQRAHAASQYRIRSLYELSSEQRYLHFSRRFPGFVQRIPQYLLASYLGLTPEYLSEIKAKRLS